MAVQPFTLFPAGQRRGGGSHVTFARSRGQAWLLEPDFELVHLAVERLWREPQDVLRMQLLVDAGERFTQLLFLLEPQHEVPASRLVRQAPQRPVGAHADAPLAV